MAKVEPWPGRLSSETSPPCARAMCLTIASPRPVPLPRPRRTLDNSAPPTFVQARPQGGRGVKGTTDEEEAEKKKKAGRTLSSRRRGPDGRRGEALPEGACA